jgi:hypothetical protein
MAFPIAAALAGGALLGAIGGGQQNKQSSTNQTILGPQSELDKRSTSLIDSELTNFQNMINAGPGKQQIDQSQVANQNLVKLLQQFAQGGFMPGRNEFQQANDFTSQLFAPQQNQMMQQFQADDEEIARIAARLGRDPNDPVLRNKLAQTRNNAMQTLGAQKTSFMNEFAQNLPMQRLNFASQLSQVQGNLATQALANRQALLSLGQNLKSQEQNFRLGTATQMQTGVSGGGASGAIGGALAGMGAAGSVLNSFSKPQQATTPPQQSYNGYWGNKGG